MNLETEEKVFPVWISGEGGSGTSYIIADSLSDAVKRTKEYAKKNWSDEDRGIHTADKKPHSEGTPLSEFKESFPYEYDYRFLDTTGKKKRKFRKTSIDEDSGLYSYADGGMTYTITRQRGFADKEDHYVIEDENENILQDEDGNVFEFESHSDAEEYIEELQEDDYADGGTINLLSGLLKVDVDGGGYIESIKDREGKELFRVTVNGIIYERNPKNKKYTNIDGIRYAKNEYLHISEYDKSDYAKGGEVNTKFTIQDKDLEQDFYGKSKWMKRHLAPWKKGFKPGRDDENGVITLPQQNLDKFIDFATKNHYDKNYVLGKDIVIIESGDYAKGGEIYDLKISLEKYGKFSQEDAKSNVIRDVFLDNQGIINKEKWDKTIKEQPKWKEEWQDFKEFSEIEIQNGNYVNPYMSYADGGKTLTLKEIKDRMRKEWKTNHELIDEFASYEFDMQGMNPDEKARYQGFEDAEDYERWREEEEEKEKKESKIPFKDRFYRDYNGFEISSLQFEGIVSVDGKNKKIISAYDQKILNPTIKELKELEQEMLREEGYAEGGEIEVGDWVQHKKGDASGRGQVYKKDDLGIYLKDQYGNENHKIFQTRNFKHKGKPKYADGGDIFPLQQGDVREVKNVRGKVPNGDWEDIKGGGEEDIREVIRKADLSGFPVKVKGKYYQKFSFNQFGKEWIVEHKTLDKFMITPFVDGGEIKVGDSKRIGNIVYTLDTDGSKYNVFVEHPNGSRFKFTHPSTLEEAKEIFSKIKKRNPFASGGQTKKSNAGLVGILAVAVGVLIGRQIKL